VLLDLEEGENKKVFADYYYGDEIFSKTKNAAKKKQTEKQKIPKVRGKYKTHKKESNEETPKVTLKSKDKFVGIYYTFEYFIQKNY